MKFVKNSFLLSLFALLLFFYLGCEKDDICLAETPATPSLVLRFYNIENPEIGKSPNDLRIRPIGVDTLIVASEEVKLALRTDQEFTEFEFILNYGNETEENTDRIQINYNRKDIYINRACGYRAQFILENNAVRLETADQAWIKDAVLLEPTINDETTIHLGLLH